MPQIPRLGASSVHQMTSPTEATRAALRPTIKVPLEHINEVLKRSETAYTAMMHIRRRLTGERDQQGNPTKRAMDGLLFREAEHSFKSILKAPPVKPLKRKKAK